MGCCGSTPSESQYDGIRDPTGGYEVPAIPKKSGPGPTFREYSGDELCQYPKGGKYWVTDPWEKRTIPLAKKGLASTPPVTVFELVDKCVAKRPGGIHMRKEYKNKFDQYEWKTWTRQEMYDEIRRAARAFVALGLQPWESIAIIGFNAPEWFIAYFAAMYAGGLAAGMYTTNNPGQCEYIMNHSKARVAVVENEAQLKKFLEIRDNCETLSAIVMWDGSVPDGANEDGKARVLSWEQMMQQGDDEKLEDEVKSRIDQIDPSQCASLIYTSGTTGPPKAVMMSHDNLTYHCRVMLGSMKDINFALPHRIVSYLPVSHVAAQVFDMHAPFGVILYGGGEACVYFARPDALKGSLSITLGAVRPTLFFGVPRVWEKIQEKMIAKGKDTKGLKRKLVDFSKKRGLQASENAQVGGSQKLPSGHGLANKLVHSAVKQALGLDQCKLFVTGAAKMKQSTMEFFHALGIRLMDAYGMSETAGVHNVGRNFHFHKFSAGATIDSYETVIQHDPNRDKKGEGEVCMRGRNIMMGYMYNPEKTAQTIDDEGFIHSGDVGRKDKYGLLRITGRIKELIITAGGENVAPVPIENYLKDELTGLSNIVLIGEQKKFLTCLVTLKVKPTADATEFTNELDGEALDVSPGVTTVEQARKDATWKEYIEAGIKKYNADEEACVSRACRIQYYRILDQDFSVPGGELTSTMKVKRPIVLKKYAGVIADMYPDA